MLTRRHALVLIGAGIAAAPAGAVAQGMSRVTAYAFSFPGLKGGDIRLADYAGKPILVVNTASQCGYTPQYAGLQELWTRYRDRGLMIVGVPSNDFGGQEPGTEAEIKTFCDTKFGVTFPMTRKEKVVGGAAHPFYKWAAEMLGESNVPKWNFHKYLVDADGKLAAAFGSRVEPKASELKEAIEANLPKQSKPR